MKNKGIAYRGHFISFNTSKRSIDILINDCKMDSFLGSDIGCALDYAKLLIDEIV